MTEPRLVWCPSCVAAAAARGHVRTVYESRALEQSGEPMTTLALSYDGGRRVAGELWSVLRRDGESCVQCGTDLTACVFEVRAPRRRDAGARDVQLRLV